MLYLVYMKQYLDLLKTILDNGTLKHNRTGVDTISYPCQFIRHDMRTGFPLLTTKKVGLKTVCGELEMFIKGEHSKKFLHERNVKIWNEWCNPQKVPYGHDEETQEKMREEDDLGEIYGVNWNNWNNTELNQLRNAIETLKTNPTDRRMIVSAWNPERLDHMALPPCHFCFQLISDGEYVDLLWNQRSLDTFLGGGFDLASYGMLLTLICHQVKMTPRFLAASFGDAHIYVNHIDQVKEQLLREPYPLPTVKILNADDPDWTIWDWKYTDFELLNYQCHPAIKAPIAI